MLFVVTWKLPGAKMKTRDPNLMLICAVVVVVLSFTGKSKSREYPIRKNVPETFTVKNKSDAYLLPVGRYSVLF